LAPLRRAQVIADRYELQQEVGRGGMGEVWLALDRELDRPVALKFHDRQASEARFEREAHTAAALSHPNIVRIYDYGLADGRPYLVLEHLAGGTLADRLASADALADSEAEQVARDIAAALAHAHAQGVVHRDLKPSNILFGADGRAKLVDFGIARSSEQGTLTEAGSLLGTAAYMSPEQAAGEAPIGAAADVYAFGVILFQMLTGRLPFEGDSPLELAFKHRTAAPPDLGSYRRDAPPRLASLVARALAKEPASRPPDGSALLEALDAAIPSQAPTEATAPLTKVVTPRWRPRQKAFAALAALVTAGFAAAWFALPAGESAPSPAPAGHDSVSGSRSAPTESEVSTGLGTIPPSAPVSTTETQPATTATTSTTASTSATTTATTTSSGSTTTSPDSGTTTEAAGNLTTTQP
jgi:eukaryotic-like serine/threonine-protein kinase